MQVDDNFYYCACSNYSHVQSKVDTGLAAKAVAQPTAKPPLRREESTAGLAARAAARNRVRLTIFLNSNIIKCYFDVYFLLLCSYPLLSAEI